MRKYLQEKTYDLSNYIELLVSAILTIALIVLSIRMLGDTLHLTVFASIVGEEVLTDLMGRAMTIAIGVEFIKMLCKHTPDTIIEVLLFAIARQLVTEHASNVETLIGVIAIAGLFFTRKYLFVNFDETEVVTFRGSQKVHVTNVLAHIHIPEEDGELLRDVVVNKLAEEGKKPSIGSCVYYTNFALRVSSMRNDMVTRVDIIRSI